MKLEIENADVWDLNTSIWHLNAGVKRLWNWPWKIHVHAHPRFNIFFYIFPDFSEIKSYSIPWVTT